MTTTKNRCEYCGMELSDGAHICGVGNAPKNIVRLIKIVTRLFDQEAT